MTVAAGQEAVHDSGLNLDELDRNRVAVVMGTAYGASSHVEDFYVSLLRDGPRGAQPFLFPETVPNAPASHMAMVHGITGPNSTFCQNEISAEIAMLYARSLLLRQVVDVALVGGADELTPILYGCYDALRALNPIKVAGSEPVQPEIGKGLVLGEGAGVLVLERLQSATDRGARVYGRIHSGVVLGGAAALGHYEVKGRQMARAVRLALEPSGMGADAIDQLHVSANFSKELDQMESQQIRALFPGRSDGPGVTPLKYLMGDFGGAGALRTAAILLSLYRRIPLPTLEARVLSGDPAHALKWDPQPDGGTGSALMTSSTFGGGTVSLVFTAKGHGEPT
jgi:3-oxoacyl-(acyl-carrier-protein) synthase